MPGHSWGTGLNWVRTGAEGPAAQERLEIGVRASSEDKVSGAGGGGVWASTGGRPHWGGSGAPGGGGERGGEGGAEGGCLVADLVPIGSQANSSSSAFRSANGHLTREFSMAAQRIGNLIGCVCRSVAPGGRLRTALPRRRQPIGSLPRLRHWLRRLRPELRASWSPTSSSFRVLAAPRLYIKVEQTDEVRLESVSLAAEGRGAGLGGGSARRECAAGAG